MRYYSTLRPISIGCFPHGHEVTEICNFQKREFVKKINREAWGYIDFADNLTEKEADQYDLIPEELKTYYGVIATIYDDGRKKARHYTTECSVAKPEDTEKPGKGKYTYLCWFDSKEEADDFIKENMS